MMKRRQPLVLNFLSSLCFSLLPFSQSIAASKDVGTLGNGVSISILAAVAHNNLAALDERLSISTLFGLQGLAYYGSSMTGSRIGKTWQAINTHGQLVRSQEQVGKLHLYYFGFTQCPDICPSALANLSLLYTELSPQEQAQLQLVFVSIDPERDTPTVVQAYLDNFEGEFMGLTGSPEQIAQMAQQFRVKYRKVPYLVSQASKTRSLSSDASEHLSAEQSIAPQVEAVADYTMEHSSQFFLFDKKAQPRLFYHSDADTHKIAQDIRHILGE